MADDEFTDDENIESLIEFFRRQLLDIDEVEVAELSEYAIETEEGVFRADPQKRLMKMIEAFESVVKLEHVGTLNDISSRISAVTDGRMPQIQLVPTPNESGLLPDPIPLELADLTEVLLSISNLRRLIAGEEGLADE